MNCKPGDIAVVVCWPLGDWRDLTGRMVRVTQPHDGESWKYEPLSPDMPKMGDLWTFGYPILAIVDSCLRPIRDQEGEDESISWVRKANMERERKELERLK